MLPIKQAVKRRFTMPSQITCAGKTGKHENCIFHSNAALVHQSLLDFFNLFDSRLISHAAVWLPKSCNQCVQLGTVGGHGSGERKSTALQQLDCVARTVTLICGALEEHLLTYLQCTSALSSELPVSQGNAEALDRPRWRGKTKHRLISYFLSKTSAKNIVIGSCISRL